jgi:polysaccharide deacetylase family protein (PEP-CTERM system associated)
MAARNAFTVDLEDWYHGLTSTNRRPHVWPELESRVVASTERLLALLKACKVQATVFVLGKVAERYPDLVRRVADDGHEIGVHGFAHADIRHMTPERFADELDQALEVLAPLVHEPIIGHRGPYFSINRDSLWALEVLRERGFRYDSSFFPTRSLLYGYPEAPRWPHRIGNGSGLVEFPISTVRVGRFNWPVAGGFYTRALPYGLIRRGIEGLNRQGHPAILYVHPWELDTRQRYNQVTLRERISHYYGRRGLAKKLRRLFTDFEFGPLRDMLDVNPIGYINDHHRT